MKKIIRLVTIFVGVLLFGMSDFIINAAEMEGTIEYSVPLEASTETGEITEEIQDIEQTLGEVSEDLKIDEQGSELVDSEADNISQEVESGEEIKYDEIISITSKEYYAQVLQKNEGIYTKPKGTENSILYTTYKFNMQNLLVVEEATTNSGVFSKLVRIDTGQKVGWININDLKIYDSFLDRNLTEYYAQVLPTNKGIFTNPPGTYNSILYTSYKYNSQKVKVIEEITTISGVYSLLVDLDSSKVLGWINKNDLSVYNAIKSTQAVQYYGIINPSNTGIYTQPKGTQDAILYTSYKYNSKAIRVLEEAETDDGIFIKIESVEDNRELGWINKNDVSVLDDIYINQEQTKKFAVVNPLNQGIYTQPQGSFNSVLYTSYKFNNKAVKVVEEADTLTGKYSKILRIEDNSTIGWIKTSEITETNFTKTISIHNFYGKVITGNDGIYTKPFGDFDSILYTTYKYNNNEVKIIEEVTTVSGNFYKISDILSGKILGWIRSSSIEKYDRIEDVTSMELYGFVRSGNDGIYTKPKGLPGAILYTTYKMNNKEVKAIERVKVDNIEFLKLTELTSGKFIGWIKASDIELYESIQSTIKREYSAKVSQKNQGIYTAPKGTYGAILYTSYLFNNKYVKVVEESVTDSGTFSKLVRVEDGSTIGWINKDDLITQRTVFIDAGHGGSDSGAHYYGVSEKDINLQVANKLKAQLEAQGYAVIMSRTTDVFVDIVSERSEMANKSGAEIFVSIHHNAMPGNSIVNGIETFHYQYNSSYPPIINQDMHNDENRLLKSAALANEIQNSLISNTGAYDRGVQRETFAVLRETALPAVLLELGFMSNSTELNKLTTSTYQNTLANAVTLGINSYFKTN